MFDSKFICTLTALIITVITICNLTPAKGNNTVEGFGMNPPLMFYKTRILQNTKTGKMTELQGNYLANSNSSNSKPEFFQVPPNFQANISPRFANTDFGANIRYNTPASRYMASPKTPLGGARGYANAVQENYTENYGCSNCGGSCTSASSCTGSKAVSCRTPGPQSSPPPGFVDGDYNKILESFPTEEISELLPVGTMSSLNSEGETEQFKMFDRMIYSTAKSNLQSQGDYIRGDLAIQPCNTGWFQVSANPARDLNQGAMNVLTGSGSASQASMDRLIVDATGSPIVGGVQLSSSYMSSLGLDGSTLNVTAFA